MPNVQGTGSLCYKFRVQDHCGDRYRIRVHVVSNSVQDHLASGTGYSLTGFKIICYMYRIQDHFASSTGSSSFRYRLQSDRVQDN